MRIGQNVSQSSVDGYFKDVIIPIAGYPEERTWSWRPVEFTTSE